LGKLSAAQVDKGFAVLEKLGAAITQGRTSNAVLEPLCNEFYTVIPHSFGRVRPPIIREAEAVQQKKDMLSVLSDIALAQEFDEKR